MILLIDCYSSDKVDSLFLYSSHRMWVFLLILFFYLFIFVAQMNAIFFEKKDASYFFILFHFIMAQMNARFIEKRCGLFFLSGHVLHGDLPENLHVGNCYKPWAVSCEHQNQYDDSTCTQVAVWHLARDYLCGKALTSRHGQRRGTWSRGIGLIRIILSDSRRLAGGSVDCVCTGPH